MILAFHLDESGKIDPYSNGCERTPLGLVPKGKS